MDEVLEIKKIIKKKTLYTISELNEFQEILIIILQSLDNLGMIRNITTSQINLLVKKYFIKNKEALILKESIKKVNRHLYLKENEYNELELILNKVLLKLKRINNIISDINYYELLEKIDNEFKDFNVNDFRIVYELIIESDLSEEEKRCLLLFISNIINKEKIILNKGD